MRVSLRGPILAIGLVVVFAGTALATASSGFHPTIVGRATLSDPVQYNTGLVKFQTKGEVDIVTISVAIDPNGSSRWLTHPGVLLGRLRQPRRPRPAPARAATGLGPPPRCPPTGAWPTTRSGRPGRSRGGSAAPCAPWIAPGHGWLRPRPTRPASSSVASAASASSR